MKCYNCGKKIEPPKRKYCNEACGDELRSKVLHKYIKYKKKKCEICGRSHSVQSYNYNNSLLVHHLDEDIRNNKQENLITVCKSCHGFLHSKRFKTILEYILNGKICYKELN